MSRGAARLVLTALLPFALGYLLSFLFRSINAVTAPNFRLELGLDAASIGVLTSAYFFAFSLSQLPMGILMDRFGPRRCSALLLLVAALGGVVFATADTLGQLMLGRALIGLGVSIALMAAFQANALFWPLHSLSSVNACTMAFGGLGAAAATLPVQWALQFTSWRSLFFGLAALSIAVALYQWLAVPERLASRSRSWREELDGLLQILGARRFWVATLGPCCSLGLWMSFNSFWIAPWLRDVAGFDEPAVGVAMLAVAGAIIVAYFCGGTLSDLLARSGLSGGKVLLIYGTAFMAVQLLPALNLTAAPLLMWFCWVALGGGSVVIYALLTRAWPGTMAGRVNTAANMVCLAIAFIVQAAVGPLLDLLQLWGASRAEAWQAILLAVIAIQLLAWLWYASDPETRALN